MSFAGAYGKTDEAQAHRTLAKALDLGVDHLDTALIYGGGVSENYIGSFIKDHPNRFKIATKGGIVTQPKRHFDNSEASLRAQLEGSLKRLGVEHVDLYYIHRRQPEIPIEDVMGTLVKFKEEGKIGGIGLSEVAPYTLRRAVKVHPVTAVQNEYSLWTRLPELGLLQACAETGTGFVAFATLGRGIFSNAMPVMDALSENDFRRSNPRFIEPDYSLNRAIVSQFVDYANGQGMSPSTMANAWVLQRHDHVVVIPGTRSPEHLAENVMAADTVLSAEQLAEIDRLLPVGFAFGDRYSDGQAVGPERYC